jgi:hypothetical protein
MIQGHRPEHRKSRGFAGDLGSVRSDSVVALDQDRPHTGLLSLKRGLDIVYASWMNVWCCMHMNVDRALK